MRLSMAVCGFRSSGRYAEGLESGIGGSFVWFTSDTSAHCCVFASARSIVAGEHGGRVHLLELMGKSASTSRACIVLIRCVPFAGFPSISRRRPEKGISRNVRFAGNPPIWANGK